MTSTPSVSAHASDDDAVERLERELDRLSDDREPLDVSAIDGFLCGVLLQPKRIPIERWLAPVLDAEGRAPPPSFDAQQITALLRARHAELDRAIERRAWFDPWVFETSGADSPSQCVEPWVTGFSLATERFPSLTAARPERLLEPLALLYRHLDPDDLEDADELLETMHSLEPPVTLEEAVEDLVQATLLLADVSRPIGSMRQARPRGTPVRATRHASPTGGGRLRRR